MFEIKQLPVWEKRMKKYKYCVWHHSLTEDHVVLGNFEAIKKYHMEKYGWRDIGYNIVIEKVAGKVVARWGRPLGMEGAHTKENGRNRNAIGICIVGNFDSLSDNNLTQEHYDVAREVVRVLNEFLGYELIHEPHRKHATYKSCPGKDFPFEAFIKYITKPADAHLGYTDLDPISSMYQATKYAIEHDIMVGDDKSKFRPKETPTREELAQTIYNLLKHLGKV